MTAIASTTVSGIILPAAAVLVSLLVGIGGVWTALRVGFPQRRLLFGLSVVAPLLTAPSGVRDDLELTHRSVVLAQPHLLEIQLLSRGSKDISSSAFDNGEPLRLNVDAHIIAMLQIKSEPEIRAVPKLDINGATLEIGPSLIGRRQKITITLLADGERPHLSCQSSLENVDVRRLRPDQAPTRERTIGGAIGLSAATIAIGVWWILVKTGLVKVPIYSPQEEALKSYSSIAFALTIAALLMWWVVWRRSKREANGKGSDAVGSADLPS